MAKITNNLLKQAIADAEAVRETAVANAKFVLEEAITPQIREMIARRLRVEADMGEEDEDEEKGHEMKKEGAKELPHQEAEAEGGKDFPADTSTIGGAENKDPSDDSFDTSAIGDGGENKEDSSTDWYDDWSESDFDLDEVIRELEEDIAALSETEHEEDAEDEGAAEEEDSDEPSPSKEAKPNPFAAKKEEKPNPFAAKKEVAHDTEDADVQKFAKAPVMPEEMDMDSDEEDIDLEEILAELEAEDDEMHGAEKTQMHGSETKQMADKLAGLKKELAQYREAVNILSGRLNEVNLLNAKLLFTNKMFRNQGLNTEQKVRIVESFDRATTVREVKLVYTALVENLSTQAKTFSASRKKVVSEGFASKATPSTAPKKDVIVENSVAKRLQELAGII
jgi:hypothetical protein